MSNAECLLRATGLAKSFQTGAGELKVFEDITLEVAPGEMLAVVGESGTGKSTLLQILGALDTPSNGELYFKSVLISSLGEDALADLRNREMGFVWQLHHLLPEFTARENVALPLRLRGAGAAEAVGKADRLLEEVGLYARRDHRPGQLSGGEQQRVALARALANGPSLLLADEPTGNLDQKTGEMVLAMIQELHQSHRLTSILVTHNPAFARRCHRVVELAGGGLRPVSG
jgi:lipoprotein-releasing system ATP-binding protein